MSSRIPLLLASTPFRPAVISSLSMIFSLGLLVDGAGLLAAELVGVVASLGESALAPPPEQAEIIMATNKSDKFRFVMLPVLSKFMDRPHVWLM